MVPSQHAGSNAWLACHHGWPLVRAAFSAIIEPTIVSCVGPGCPLVMVCEADLSRLLDDLRLACSESHPRRAVLLDGRGVARKRVTLEGGLQFEEVFFNVDVAEKGAVRIEVAIEPFADEE